MKIAIMHFPVNFSSIYLLEVDDITPFFSETEKWNGVEFFKRRAGSSLIFIF